LSVSSSEIEVFCIINLIEKIVSKSVKNAKCWLTIPKLKMSRKFDTKTILKPRILNLDAATGTKIMAAEAVQIAEFSLTAKTTNNSVSFRSSKSKRTLYEKLSDLVKFI